VIVPELVVAAADRGRPFHVWQQLTTGRRLHNLGVDRVVESALEAIERKEWDRLRATLHPYIHWTTGDGERLRGRVNVLAMLATSPVPSAPAEHELRDGQIYRWTEPG